MRLNINRIIVVAITILLLAPPLIQAQSVTIHIDNGQVKTALDSISQQTDIPVIDLYWLLKRKKAKKVTIHVDDEILYNVLQTLSKDQPFYLSLSEGIKVIVREQYEEVLRDGQVLDQNEQPVANVTVKNLRTGTSTVTTPKGSYFLDTIIPNMKLKVHGPIIEPVTVVYKKNTPIRLQRLAINNVALVSINTGYQHFKKNNNLGSDYSVKQPLFQQRVAINAAHRLEGIVPALTAPASNTLLNQPSWFSIGARTSLISPDPMIVINNFPLEGNPININTDDIEDITVLRDATAVGIWGARAANGVVVIKTKSAKYIERFRLSFNASVSVAPKPNLFQTERMGAADHIFVDTTLFKTGYFTALEKNRSRPPLSPVVEALYNKTMTPDQRLAYFDSLGALDNRYQQSKHFYRPRLQQHYFIQCEAGSSSHNVYMSAGYNRIHPEWQQSSEERKTTLFNFNKRLKTLEISAGISVAEHVQKNMDGVPVIPQPYEMLLDNNNNEVAARYKIRYAYIDTVVKNKLFNWKYYPLQEFRLRNKVLTENDNRYDIALKWDAGKITPGLVIGAYWQYQATMNQLKEVHDKESFFTRDLVNSYSQITPGQVLRPIPEGHIADLFKTKRTVSNLRFQLSYAKKWGSNTLILMAGQDRIISKDNYSRKRIYGYSNENPSGQNALNYQQLFPMFHFPAAKAYIPYPDLARSLFRIYSSGYLNGMFRLKEKYDFTVSARRERSNLYTPSINNGKTPLLAGGFAWQPSSERFYHCTWLPFVKLNATYGSTGQPPYPATSRATIGYSGLNSNNDPYAFFTNPPQYALQWERVRNLNIGLNVKSANDRIELSLNWYSKSASDLVGNKIFDPTLGYNYDTGNVGAIRSRNLDIVIESKNVNRKLRWNTNFMMSVVNDKVTHTEDTVLPAWMYCEPNFFSTVKGKPLYGLFSFAFKGLDNAGNPLGNKDTNYIDMVMANGSSSLRYSGRATPALFGSITNDFSYKKWSLSVTVLYKLNYYFRRQSIDYYNLYLGLSAGSADFSRRWQKPGDEKNTNVPSMPVTASPDHNRDLFYNYSSILIERADHVRLQNVQLTYNLEGKALNKSCLRMANIFINCSNLGILWRANKWGLDPDQFSGYRQPALYTIGFKGTFK